MQPHEDCLLSQHQVVLMRASRWGITVDNAGSTACSKGLGIALQWSFQKSETAYEKMKCSAAVVLSSDWSDAEECQYGNLLTDTSNPPAAPTSHSLQVLGC